MNMSESIHARRRKAEAARSRFLMVVVFLMILAAFAPGTPFSDFMFEGSAGGGGFSAVADFGAGSSR